MVALSGWQSSALPGTRYHRALGALLHDSAISGLLRTSRCLLWRVLEHNSATVAFKEYRGAAASDGYCVIILM